MRIAGRIIDGKATAATIRSELKATIETLAAKAGRKPGLAVILVGDDGASQTYVRNKERACRGLYPVRPPESAP